MIGLTKQERLVLDAGQELLEEIQSCFKRLGDDPMFYEVDTVLYTDGYGDSVTALNVDISNSLADAINKYLRAVEKQERDPY